MPAAFSGTPPFQKKGNFNIPLEKKNLYEIIVYGELTLVFKTEDAECQSGIAP